MNRVNRKIGQWDRSQDNLDELIYGILTARRAGATKKDVVNCMTASALKKWLARTRQ